MECSVYEKYAKLGVDFWQNYSEFCFDLLYGQNGRLDAFFWRKMLRIVNGFSIRSTPDYLIELTGRERRICIYTKVDLRHTFNRKV